MNKKLITLFSTIALAIPLFASSCGKPQDDGLYHISFNPVTSLKTNKIPEQTYDKNLENIKVKEPTLVIIDDNPENFGLYGWYTSSSFEKRWDFDNDIVTSSMTLYGKFEKQYDVRYYQAYEGGSYSLVATEHVFKDDEIPVREDLPDCYENLGLFYLKDIERDGKGNIISARKNGTVDFEKDRVSSELDLLYERSEHIYLDAGAFSRRFHNVAASEGRDGSTPGNITIETDSKTGEEYARCYFGWAKTIADPFIFIDWPFLDVHNSQYLEITMKNIGPAKSLTFYWTGKWKDGSWINGKETHSYNEEARYTFANGTKSQKDTENTCYHDINGNTYVYNQKETDDWQTYLIPISRKLSNGVSTWANASVITALRIQSGYFNKENDDNKNILLIKSIKGVSNSEYIGFKDSEVVNKLKISATPEEIAEAAKQQEQVNGFILPKNNNDICDLENTKVSYQKDGTTFYGDYFSGKQSYTLKVPNDRTVDISENTTFKFRYCNFSYVNKISFTFFYEFTREGKSIETSISQDFSMPTNMTDFYESKINLGKIPNFTGKITKIVIDIVPKGVDNMIEFQYLKFAEYEALPTVGINFDSKNYGGFVISSGMKANYDMSVIPATTFTVTSDTNLAYNEDINYDMTAVKELKLTYTNSDLNVNKVIFTFKDSGNTTLATAKFTIDQIGSKKVVTVPFALEGTFDKVYLSFVGKGSISLHALNFVYPSTAIDMSTRTYSTLESIYKNDLHGFSYDGEELGMTSSLLHGKTDCNIYARLGVRPDLVLDGKKIYNMSLINMHKLYVVYQNRSSQTTMQLGYCVILKSEHPEDYLTYSANAGDKVTIGGESKAGGLHVIENIQTNMQSGEWAVATLDIDPFFTTAKDECYITTFIVTTAVNLDDVFIVRNLGMF